jgi:phosphoribosyl 1,2-cyclic phosphodiesterase
MRARFWGVRGSVPWAGRPSVRHGTNTPCIELRDDSGDRLVLDAGTGLVGLGDTILGAGDEAAGSGVPILLTHYHWDHIQGLPAFAPFFAPGSTVRVIGPTFPSGQVGHLRRLLGPPFCARAFDELPSVPEVEAIAPGRHEVAGFAVSAVELTHPGGAMAYRIRGAAGDLVYATDHEFGNAEVDERLAAFAHGAAMLVSDAHFTPEEEPRVKGWGHGTWARVAEFAARNAVARLWLFHHKPGRSDAALDHIVECARTIFPQTFAAAEGTIVDV